MVGHNREPIRVVVAGVGAVTSQGPTADALWDGVKAGRWRILVGDDAHALDTAVRADPEKAYDPDGPTLATFPARG